MTTPESKCPLCGFAPTEAALLVPSAWAARYYHMALAHHEDTRGEGVKALVRVGAPDSEVARVARSWTEKVDKLLAWVDTGE